MLDYDTTRADYDHMSELMTRAMDIDDDDLWDRMMKHLFHLNKQVKALESVARKHH